MIPFFRNLRKKFLKESRISRYLIYATGEILLVVIGILIALQVNNWNQNRKDRNLGTNYLSRIASDLRKDTTLLNQKIQLADQLSKGYLQFIKKMYETQRNKEDYIRLFGTVEFNVDELILNEIAYAEMVNTGRLDLITDINIKEKLTEYYRQYDFIASRVKELNASNLELINAAGLLAPNLKYALQDYLQIHEQEIIPNSDHMFFDSEWAYINDPQSMTFRLYEEAIYYYYLKQTLLKPMFEELKEQAAEILEILSNEIN